MAGESRHHPLQVRVEHRPWARPGGAPALLGERRGQRASYPTRASTAASGAFVGQRGAAGAAHLHARRCCDLIDTLAAPAMLQRRLYLVMLAGRARTRHRSRYGAPQWCRRRVCAATGKDANARPVARPAGRREAAHVAPTVGHSVTPRKLGRPGAAHSPDALLRTMANALALEHRVIARPRPS